jgi:hypothetical protein
VKPPGVQAPGDEPVTAPVLIISHR